MLWNQINTLLLVQLIPFILVMNWKILQLVKGMYYRLVWKVIEIAKKEL
jgi:hypothetical protein